VCVIVRFRTSMSSYVTPYRPVFAPKKKHTCLQVCVRACVCVYGCVWLTERVGECICVCILKSLHHHTLHHSDLHLFKNKKRTHVCGSVCVCAHVYDSFNQKCYILESHQIEKLWSLGISRYKFKLRLWFNLHLYRGI